MNYLIAYPEEIKNQVRSLISQNRLSEVLLQKYSSLHDIRTDKALYSYVIDLKNNFIRNAIVHISRYNMLYVIFLYLKYCIANLIYANILTWMISHPPFLLPERES